MRSNEHLFQSLYVRDAPLEMGPEEFRVAGYQVVNRIADFLASLPQRPVSPGKTPGEIRCVLGESSLPDRGTPPEELLDEAADLLFDNSTFNGHARFLGYITSSATPIGALGDFLAGAINPNVGGWELAPMGTEIEAQTVRWIAELVGYPSECGGLLVSGGNMANFVGFLAARKAKASWDVRTEGLLKGDGRQLLVYVSQETHTWVQKAADLFGLGTNAIRWIATDQDLRMDTAALRSQIERDLADGGFPFLVVGTAGTVSTGAVDPLPEIATICREYDVWFHVDGAYGAFAAALPDAPQDLKGLSQADSVAMDPHKWLYSPLEAGCTLVRNPEMLIDTFSYHPIYYHFQEEGGEPAINYYEYGLQNSRGFRALKVWLGLRQAGREGYVRMIRDDIELAQALYQLAGMHPDLQVFSHNLSITTFRYVPTDLSDRQGEAEAYLNDLNTELLERLQHSGEAFVSNAVIDGCFVLRACVVNFRTTLADIEALPNIIARIGKEVDSEMRPAALQVG